MSCMQAAFVSICLLTEELRPVAFEHLLNLSCAVSQVLNPVPVTVCASQSQLVETLHAVIEQEPETRPCVAVGF